MDTEEVKITKEDVRNTENFFNHFEIEIPDYLKKILHTIRESDSITPSMQKEMRIGLSKALVESDSLLLKDELFKEVMPNCQKIDFDASFEKDFEEL